MLSRDDFFLNICERYVLPCRLFNVAYHNFLSRIFYSWMTDGGVYLFWSPMLEFVYAQFLIRWENGRAPRQKMSRNWIFLTRDPRRLGSFADVWHPLIARYGSDIACSPLLGGCRHRVSQNSLAPHPFELSQCLPADIRFCYFLLKPWTLYLKNIPITKQQY